MPIKPLGERIKHLQKRKRKGKLGDKGGARLDKLKTKQYGKRHDQDAELPPDPQYISDMAGVNRDYNFGSAQLAQQGGLLNYETGIGDASNPYSRAALLQKSYETNQRGSTNSYAASGQLYSGALQNARNANVADLHQGQHALGLDYLKAQAGLTGAQTQLGYSRDDAMQAAMAANVARAAAEPVRACALQQGCENALFAARRLVDVAVEHARRFLEALRCNERESPANRDEGEVEVARRIGEELCPQLVRPLHVTVDGVRSLRRDPHAREPGCWIHAGGFCLSREPVPTAPARGEC